MYRKFVGSIHLNSCRKLIHFRPLPGLVQKPSPTALSEFGRSLISWPPTTAYTLVCRTCYISFHQSIIKVKTWMNLNGSPDFTCNCCGFMSLATGGMVKVWRRGWKLSLAPKLRLLTRFDRSDWGLICLQIRPNPSYRRLESLIWNKTEITIRKDQQQSVATWWPQPLGPKRVGGSKGLRAQMNY